MACKIRRGRHKGGMIHPTAYHISSSGHRIAYQQRAGEGAVGVTFIHGFRSDMASTKATAMSEWCAARNIPFTVFDCFAHGQSDGDFLEFTIGRALESTLEILDHVASGDQILVGSSMGGWISLLAARERKGQVRGLVGIAAAPDFTEDIWLRHMTPEHRATVENEGVIWVPSDYGSDYPITQQFIRDGRHHLLLDDVIGLDIPMHFIQGQQDADVPWETALEIAKAVTSDEVAVHLIKDGEHRLSRPQDLAAIFSAVEKLLA